MFPASADPSRVLHLFRESLETNDPRGWIADGIIGNDLVFEGIFESRRFLYADYVASGRPIRQVEEFISTHVLPLYANPHTEASYCGTYSTRLRLSARRVIGSLTNSDSRHAVIFCGSGATAALNRLVTLLGASEQSRANLNLVSKLLGRDRRKRVRVILGPYEHHSNILPWRESGAEIIELDEAPGGGPDLEQLEHVLVDSAQCFRVICSFSAASNITGITANVVAATRLAKSAGAVMVWDYAGGAPYLDINMMPEVGLEIDAIALSPHKFVGGPGASGVLIVRREAVVSSRPAIPGGGTVKFVSSSVHDYLDNLEDREEGGTPNYIGDVRAALAFLVKDAIGVDFMVRRNEELTRRAIAAWKDVSRLELLGSLAAPRLPIFSFLVRAPQGGYVHPQLVTRILSDRYGIQARGGCACAGPYAHHLLAISPSESAQLRREILAGNEENKPGFTRINLSVLMSEEKIRFILESIAALPDEVTRLQRYYRINSENGLFER